MPGIHGLSVIGLNEEKEAKFRKIGKKVLAGVDVNEYRRGKTEKQMYLPYQQFVIQGEW